MRIFTQRPRFGNDTGDDFVLTGPTERLTEFENEMTGVYPVKAKLISYGSTESIKALNRRLRWGKPGILYQHKKGLGYEMKPAIDAKATEHILHRQVVGRLKHIDVAYLWMLDEVRSKRLQVRRVKSEENVAGLGTEPLSKKR